MATSFRFENGTLTTLASTELNSLASATGVLSTTTFDNSAAGNQYFLADFELLVTFGTAPTAGKTVDLYLIPALDGSNYADGGNGVTPGPHFIGSYPLRNVTTAQRLAIRGVPLSPVLFKLLIVNSADQAMAASGNTLKMLPYREQGI